MVNMRGGRGNLGLNGLLSMALDWYDVLSVRERERKALMVDQALSTVSNITANT